MYIRVDPKTGLFTNDVTNMPTNKEDPNWIPCRMPPRRRSPGQSLRWSVVDGVAVGYWEGSDDPADAPASEEIKRDALRSEVDRPVEHEGRPYQFDRESRDAMEIAIIGLEASPGVTVNWRDANNQEIEMDARHLKGLYDSLMSKYAKRSLQLNASFSTIKGAEVSIKGARQALKSLDKKTLPL